MEPIIALIQRLRGPGGCPWDRQQTSRSLAPFLLEETYELLEAITRGDEEALREELGDVALHVAFQTVLAQERNAFSWEDVVRGVVDKLARRHAHILNRDEGAEGGTWETRKASQRGGASLMDGIPRALPALLRAWRCQQRAAEVGFDWGCVEEAWNKVVEEVDELEGALRHGQGERVREELGDLLMAVVSLARHLGLVAEEVLHEAVDRYATRFCAMERILGEEGVQLHEASLESMEQAWTEAKRRLGASGADCTSDRPST